MPCKKRQFKSFQQAEETAIKQSEENKKYLHPSLKPYKCPLCGKYHLTSRAGMNDQEKLNMKKEREFIKIETEHWENRFKV